MVQATHTHGLAPASTGLNKKILPPDPQMKDVLDTYADFHAPPVTSLPPKLARRGPTPADAVKALVKKRGWIRRPSRSEKLDDIEIPGPADAIKGRVYTIGVVSHTETTVEPPQAVARLIWRALEYIPPERLHPE